jgi:flagellin
MSTQISTNQILLNINSLTDGFDKISSKLSTGKKINAAKEEPVAWTSINKRYAQYAELTSAKESLDAVAASIHEVDSSMTVIGATMDLMKGTLERTKDFPPYPPGSPENEARLKMLKTFSGLRQQIEALTVPPDAGAKKIMSADTTSDWTVVVGSGGVMRTVRKAEVHTGPTGLNIPNLGPDATDDQINQAIIALDKAQVTLQDKKSQLSVDATGITEAATYAVAMATVNRQTADSANEADMTEAAAQLKSVELQQSLSFEALNISSQTDSKILQILG